MKFIKRGPLVTFAIGLWATAGATDLTPSGDTYIRNSTATTPYGSANSMVANLSGTNVRMAIFSFDLSSVTVGSLTSAKLQLQDVIGNATQSYEIWGLLDAHETFNESTLTWNTAGFLSGTTIDASKAYGGAALGTFNNTANSVNTLFDVTSGNFLNFLNASGDNDVTFVIVDTNSSASGSGWATKEHTTSLKPTLTLTAVGPPTLASGNIVDDQSGGTVVQGSLVTYTVTFSKDMDDTTVDSSDFGNAGTASFTIGSVTETSPGVFNVPVTATGAGSLRLQVNQGAILSDPSRNNLETSSAILDDTTITVTLTDVVDPTLLGITDDKSGGPVPVGTLVTYTVAFSEDMNDTTVDASDFGVTGTAGVTIGTVAETSPGVFTVPVTANSVGTMRLRINQGAILADLAGNDLDTAVEVPDDAVISVVEGGTNLVAYYSFDSDFTDGSGNGNHLTTASGTPNITTTAGETRFGGGALNLNGAESEYLSLGTTLPFGASDTWSVSFWARRTGTSDAGMVMGRAGVRNSFIWSTDAFNGMRFRPESSTTASNDFTAPKDGNYHHYAMVADGTGKLSLYVDNGAAQVINPAVGGTSFTINAIGHAYDNLAYTFHGQLDEIHIFDEAIGASKVAELFAGTPDQTDPTLVGIGDDRSGVPVEPGSLVTYTVTFSEDIDHNTVDAGDFGNAGTATFTIGGITEVSPGVFEVEITPNSAGTLQLKILSGAGITDAAGNPLDTSGAIVAGTVITVQGGFSPAGVKRLRVVFVAGQSNADGRASTSELPTSPVNLQQPQNDVDFFYRVESTIHPLTTLRPGLSETGGFGPAITCGRYLADELADGITTRIAIIKYANGGTNLYSQWAGGGTGTTSGDGSEYVRFQQTVTAGLAALASTYPNAVIELVGMVWLQGESDTGAQAVNYQTNLTNFIADVRLTYGADLRFVVIRLSNGQTAVGSLATIRAAQTAVAEADPLTGLVNSDGFGMKTDNLHFNGLGQQQNGVASAIQLLNLYPFLSPLQLAPGGGGNLSLTMNDAFDGFMYSLKSSDTMQAGDWELEEVKTAAGDTVDFTVTPSGPKRFYRVERNLAP